MDNVGGLGGVVPETGMLGQSDLRIVQQALVNNWPINDHVRRFVVSEAVKIIAKGEKVRDRVAAMKVLVAADSNNIRREANGIQEKQTDLALATAAMKEALRDPQARAKLLGLTDTLLIPGPARVSQVAPLAEPVHGTPPGG